MCLAKALSGDIQGVVFDLDGTLYWQLPVRIAMIILLVITHLHRPRQFLRTVKIIRNYRMAQEKLRLESNADVECILSRQLELTAKSTGVPAEEIKKIIDEWIQKRPLPFLRWFKKRGVVAMLDNLNHSGRRLGVYSDYPAETKLVAMGIRKYFSIVLTPKDHGVRGLKPYTTGYHQIAERMGLEASKMLYIGDREDVDRPGAEKAGMTCYIVKPSYIFSLKKQNINGRITN